MKIAKYVFYLIALQVIVYFLMHYVFSLSDPLKMVESHTALSTRILTSSAVKTSVLFLDIIFSCCFIFHIWEEVQQAGIRQRKSKRPNSKGASPSS